MATVRKRRESVSVAKSYCYQGKSLNRSNGLYLVIGALVVVVIGLGTYLYRDEKKPEGIQMNIDKNGVSVQQN
jgi:RsiW-degrading membrane proteinase PrsW (M82 family)